jgi:hypothetical protein
MMRFEAFPLSTSGRDAKRASRNWEQNLRAHVSSQRDEEHNGSDQEHNPARPGARLAR